MHFYPFYRDRLDASQKYKEDVIANCVAKYGTEGLEKMTEYVLHLWRKTDTRNGPLRNEDDYIDVYNAKRRYKIEAEHRRYKDLFKTWIHDYFFRDEKHKIRDKEIRKLVIKFYYYKIHIQPYAEELMHNEYVATLANDEARARRYALQHEEHARELQKKRELQLQAEQAKANSLSPKKSPSKSSPKGSPTKHSPTKHSPTKHSSKHSPKHSPKHS